MARTTKQFAPDSWKSLCGRTQAYVKPVIYVGLLLMQTGKSALAEDE
ncbi:MULTISPECIES: hypothetical protein [Methylomonas]|nr:hypothetical protein [Methylomonas rhizoryzae]